MKAPIVAPVNEFQKTFNEVCEKGGGPHAGPTRGNVQHILRDAGQALNAIAHKEIAGALNYLPNSNPWHVCFAMGLCWGEMALIDDTFFEAAVGCISDFNDADRKTARTFCTQKGGDIIERSLIGASRLFEDSAKRFPIAIPNSLAELIKAQNSWFRSVEKLKPSYIGPWNSTALFMVALFAQPALAKTMRTLGPILPPGGPINGQLYT